MRDILKKFSIVIFFFIDVVSGQTMALKEGDPVPDLMINQVNNYYQSSLKLSDFKGKLVILDFWGFHCVSCIQLFPKVDSFQRKYGDKMQILMVNPERQSATDSFFMKRKFIKIPNVPFVTNDTLFHLLFPHTGTPHHIWIDQEGKFFRSANHYHLNKHTLEDYLAGKPVDIPTARLWSNTPSILNPVFDTLAVFYSSLARLPDEGAVNFYPLDTIGNLYFVGSVERLFQHAFNQSPSWYHEGYSRPGLTIFDVPNESIYKEPQSRDSISKFMRDHVYYYHQRYPKNHEFDKYKFMRDDLSRYFGLTAHLEKRMVNAVILKRTSKADKLFYKKGSQETTFFELNSETYDLPYIRKIRKFPYSDFSRIIGIYAEMNMNLLFLDETGYKSDQLIDISVPGTVIDTFSFQAWNAELKRYDLELVRKSIEHDVIVIQKSEGIQSK